MMQADVCAAHLTTDDSVPATTSGEQCGTWSTMVPDSAVHAAGRKDVQVLARMYKTFCLEATQPV